MYRLTVSIYFSWDCCSSQKYARYSVLGFFTRKLHFTENSNESPTLEFAQRLFVFSLLAEICRYLNRFTVKSAAAACQHFLCYVFHFKKPLCSPAIFSLSLWEETEINGFLPPSPTLKGGDETAFLFSFLFLTLFRNVNTWSTDTQTQGWGEKSKICKSVKSRTQLLV